MSLAVIYESLKDIYHEIHRIWLHKYKIDLGIHQKWSVFEKFKYNWLGFTNEDYHNFNLRDNDYHGYISFRERWRLEDINGRFAYILGEKLIFERNFGKYIGVPHINCWVKNGRCIDMDAGKEIDILKVIENKKILIAKPTRSRGGGAGIHKITAEGNQTFIDDRCVTNENVKAAVASWEEYIIVDCINQADYSNNIFSKTTNSIRIITVQRKNRSYEVLLSFHRFGTEQSKPVDNISSGGLVAIVDIESGQIGQAKRKTEPEIMYSIHPDSGSQIEGIVIPNWKAIIDKLLQTHRCFPYYTFLAWDVVINDLGEPIILEINRGSDLGIQMIKPLRYEKMGEFMREYGLLDKRREKNFN